MNKIKFLPFVALTYAVSTAAIAGGDETIDASTSLVDSSDTAIVEATPSVEALSLDSSTVVEGLSPKASGTTVSAPSSASSSAPWGPARIHPRSRSGQRCSRRPPCASSGRAGQQ